jgi:hypothetical protein
MLAKMLDLMPPSQERRARKLLPKSVFIESSINGSREEMQSSTSSVKQVPEFERCRYNENGEVIVHKSSVNF